MLDNSPIRFLRFVLLILLLTQCNTIWKGARYSNLDVETKMSDTIFLDPVSEKDKTIFVQIRNSSGNSNISISDEITNSIIEKGYKIVKNPGSAHYILQVNVLQIGKIRESELTSSLDGGFGGALAGASIGAVASRKENATQAMIVGGVVGGIIGTVIDAANEVLTYSIITDIQISEKSDAMVKEKFTSNSKNGSGTRVISTYTGDANMKKYRSRVISTAKKINLKFEDALPQLKRGLARSIAGIF